MSFFLRSDCRFINTKVQWRWPIEMDDHSSSLGLTTVPFYISAGYMKSVSCSSRSISSCRSSRITSIHFLLSTLLSRGRTNMTAACRDHGFAPTDSSPARYQSPSRSIGSRAKMWEWDQVRAWNRSWSQSCVRPGILRWGRPTGLCTRCRRLWGISGSTEPG